MRTGFNGFGVAVLADVADEPMASQYLGVRRVRLPDNVVQLR
jgi:ornithine decarboxylase